MEQLAAQRTAALDQLAIKLADLEIALARVRELEKLLPEAKPQSGGGPGEEKSGGGPGEERA